MFANGPGSFCNKDANCLENHFCCTSNKKVFKTCHLAEECDEPPKILSFIEVNEHALNPTNITMIVLGSLVCCIVIYLSCKATVTQMLISHHEAKAK